jgi:hypothetical protein
VLGVAGPNLGSSPSHETSDGDVHVAFVVDFGIGSKMAREVAIDCLTVPRGTNGTVALALLSSVAKAQDPTYNDSGLLCSIDGYPSSGCGAASGGGYSYWSYWHGGAHWSYANVGPASWTVTNDDVEGWRFEVASAGASTDPPPEAPSSYAAACADASSHPFAVDAEPAAGSSASSLAAAAIAVAVALVLGGASVVRWRRRASTGP